MRVIRSLKKTLYPLGSIAAGFGLIVANLVVPQRAWAVGDTGGYPWADATPVRASTYDWGYRECQPAMRQAKTCTGHITTRLGVKYYQSDPWKYDVRNCTSYVAWRVQNELGVTIPGWGNANNWDNAARKAGYHVDTNPAVGAIASWEGFYGHVAFVTAVNPDGSVNVEQYNKAGTGEFSRQSRVRANTYIHIRDMPTPAATVTQQTTATVQLRNSPVATPSSASTPEPKAVIPPLESLQPTDKGDLPAKEGISYVPAVDPEANQVKVYAVEWSKTNSGKVEISQSNGADGNTTWSKRWTTDLPVTNQKDVKFLVADSNADGKLDVYAIQAASNDKKQRAITVLDGATDYKTSIGQWPTESAAPDTDSTEFSLADYDGNGSLDLYSIQKTSTAVDITILDGSAHFAGKLAAWQRPAQPEATVSYVVGDHDRDGRADVYELGTQVTVYAAENNFQLVAKSWKPEHPAEPISTPAAKPATDATTEATIPRQ